MGTLEFPLGPSRFRRHVAWYVDINVSGGHTASTISAKESLKMEAAGSSETPVPY
jgi:hypothetical protein